MTKKYALYSVGGYAREVHSSFVAKHASQNSNEKFQFFFIDDDEAKWGNLVSGCRIISYDEAKTINRLSVNVAFAGPELRKQKHQMCLEDGFDFFSVLSKSSFFGENVNLSDAAIFSENTMVTCDATIGIGFHCNIYSYVAHDCIVGDFVTFAPRVSLNGRVKVENGVYIGSDATILPGKENKFLTIGEGAVIGAGALVTKDVEPFSTVVGAPAKPLTKKR